MLFTTSVQISIDDDFTGAQTGAKDEQWLTWSQMPSVSKTGGCRFESCRPCKRKPRKSGASVSSLGDGEVSCYRFLLPDAAACHPYL
jgi:hypothetical protein